MKASHAQPGVLRLRHVEGRVPGPPDRPRRLLAPAPLRRGDLAVYGADLGAYHAANFAARYPDVVSRVICFSPEGEKLGKIRMPTMVSNLTFGTAGPEVMECVAGSCEYRLEGSCDAFWQWQQVGDCRLVTRSG